MTSKGIAARTRQAGSTIEFADVGSIRIAKIAAAQRDVSFELKPADPLRRYFNIVLQLAGASSYMQQRSSVNLVAGQWAAFDVGQLQIVVGSPAAEQMILLIPRERLESELDIKKIAARVLPGTSGMSKLLCHTASLLMEELPRMDVQRADALAQTLCGLVTMAIQERLGIETATSSMRLGLRERIQAYVDDNLRDPNLSLDQIARQLNCTKRYLHKVFQGSGGSLSEFILQHRLERCRADLENPSLATVSITEIALSWGFNSVSHFSRAFHARFGISPRTARASRPMAEFPPPRDPSDDGDSVG